MKSILNYFLILAIVITFALICVGLEEKRVRSEVSEVEKILVEDTVLVSMNDKRNVASLAKRTIYSNNDTIIQPYLLGSVQKCVNLKNEKWVYTCLDEADSDMVKPYLISEAGTIIISEPGENVRFYRLY